MTQKEKQLLLQDLCARLPYGVIIHLVEPNEDEELYCLNIPQEGLYTRSLEHHNVTTLAPIEDIKPYLRPMSNMTEEEFFEYRRIKFSKVTYRDEYKRIDVGKYHNVGIIPIDEYLDWLNAHHFDYRGLIEKGLALEAPEGMYK